ncbi:unnamed protein product, partial [Ectocarpus sp. 4 AP-2014]
MLIIPAATARAMMLLLLLVCSCCISRAFVCSPLSGRECSPPPVMETYRLRSHVERLSRQFTLRQATSRTRHARNGLHCNNGGGGARSSSSTYGDSFVRRDGGSDDKRVDRGDDGDETLSITTFNVLAPIFKRVGSGRESEFRETYLERHKAILEHIKGVGSDVVCLQELWVAEQEMVDMYRRLGLRGYRMFTLPRTESRGDGLACFVKEGIEVLDRQDLRLKGVGGRVALVLRLGIREGGEGVDRREVVVANTHLLFPHARTYEILRIRELRKLLAFLECYTQTNDLAHLPVVLCGDFNGRSLGRVYRHLAERGFRCSYEDMLGPGADFSRWITHLNHRGEEVGVDYIWFRNPDPRLGPMEPAWESIVYQSTKQQLLSSYPDEPPEETQSPGPASAAAAAAAAAVAAAAVVAATTTGRDGADTAVADEEDADIENTRLSTACQLLGLSEGFELDAEELQLLLDSSDDDFDFLVPTILDGSSTGLEGAQQTGLGRGDASGDACGSTLE